MRNDRIISTGLGLFLAFALSGCNSTGAQLNSLASSSPAPQSSPVAEASQDQSAKVGEGEESPDPQDAKDPGFLSANKAVREFAKAYWDERFIKCGTNQDGDERWFSVQLTKQTTRYLELINFRTATSPPARLSSADRLNRIWHAASTVQTTAYRWCSESPCGEYSGGVVGVELGSKMYVITIRVKDGKASSNDNPDSLYRPTCEEIKKHPIWKEY